MSDLSELIAAIDASNRAFEEFKTANDAKIEALKKGGTAPADLLPKIANIQKALGEQKTLVETKEGKMKRPNFGEGRIAVPYYFGGRELKGYVDTDTHHAHRNAVDGSMRKYRGANGELFYAEVKASSSMLGITEQ